MLLFEQLPLGISSSGRGAHDQQARLTAGQIVADGATGGDTARIRGSGRASTSTDASTADAIAALGGCSDQPLVAAPSSAGPGAIAGIAPVEDIQQIYQAVQSGSWVDGALGVAGGALDALALVARTRVRSSDPTAKVSPSRSGCRGKDTGSAALSR
ncbi:hypothetical protein [Actinoplanes sp. NPDC049316]|uniref:hypothetical protein n=1 Tax=Actinoplanes sp. NPDC049316 TaxID=3154727 RepID=UPI003417C68E